MGKPLPIHGLLLLAAGCVGPLVPVIDLKSVSPEKLQESQKVQIFTVGATPTDLPIEAHLGEITVYSCKNKVWDPPASKGNALAQLKVKAIDMGADAVMDVTFDFRGKDTWGTNCWESVTATGSAVRLKRDRYKMPNPATSM